MKRSRLSLLPALGIVGSLFVIVPAAHAGVAQGLLITADTTYEILTDEGMIDVASDITLTNVTPDKRSGDGTTDAYYYGVTLPIPIEAENVMARSGGRDLSVTVTEGEKPFYNLAEIRLRSRLDHQQTQTVQLTFDFIGAEPRSKKSGVRVNNAYVWFCAWALGDPGRATVRIVAPHGMDIDISDSQAERTVAEDGRPMWIAEDIADPHGWFIIVNGWAEDRLASRSVDVDGHVVSVRYWPGDTEWCDSVIDAVESTLPTLVETLGLEWPVEDQLVIRETVVPNTFGYGGWYLFDEDEIEIGEMVDPGLVVHELSHAWFNTDLFESRWITEGLAQAVAEMVLFDTFAERTFPEQVGVGDPGYGRLNTWVFPSSSTEHDEDAESYGYNASWIVVRELIDEIGKEGLRDVLIAALDNKIAYVGAAAPESVAETNDWRRFLDLVEQLGGATSGGELFREYVVRISDELSLDKRRAARAAYAELVAERVEWSPSILIRELMSDWEFDQAVEHIITAGVVLDAVASLENHAAELDLVAPPMVEPAYETVRWSYNGVLFLVADQKSALAAIEAAAGVVGADHDRATIRGLEGLDPGALLESGRHAFEANDLAGARLHAALATATVEHARVVGQTRLDAESLRRILVISLAGLALLALAGAVLVRWREGRRGVVTAGGDHIDAPILGPPLPDDSSSTAGDLAGPGEQSFGNPGQKLEPPRTPS